MGVDFAEQGLTLVRETLEGVLEPGVAAVVLLEALAALPDDQDLPQTAAALFELAGGPLAATLEERVGKATAAAALARVSEVLRAAVAGEDPDPSGGARPSRVSTKNLSPSLGPTRLLVVARGDRLKRSVEAAVGAHWVDAIAAHDLNSVMRLRKKHYPDLVIVDGQDSADINAIDLAGAIEAAPDQVIVVWASDQPWGNAISHALDGRGIAHADCPRAEGVAPLVDYVRARQG